MKSTPFAILVQVDYFQYLSGADSVKEFKALNETVRAFCEHCGSSIGFRAAGAAEKDFEVAVACFDEEIPIKIDVHVFTAYKVSWYEPDSSSEWMIQLQLMKITGRSTCKTAINHLLVCE